MALRNTTESYGSVSKALHWLISIMVIAMLIVGSLLGQLKSISGIFSDAHKTLGFILLFLMLIFLFWSLINPKPQYPNNMNAFELWLAGLVRILLYALVIIMCLLGWFFTTARGKPPSFFGLFSVPMPWVPFDRPLSKTGNFLHYCVAWALAGVIGLHILGALVHEFVKKDFVLKRMLGCNKFEKP